MRVYGVRIGRGIVHGYTGPAVVVADEDCLDSERVCEVLARENLRGIPVSHGVVVLDGAPLATMHAARDAARQLAQRIGAFHADASRGIVSIFADVLRHQSTKLAAKRELLDLVGRRT